MSDILSILDSKGIDYERKSYEEYVITCLAQHLHSGGVDNNKSLSINVVKGKAFCQACGFSMSSARLYSWLHGEDLDDLNLKGLEVRGLLQRLEENKESLYEEAEEFFFPSGKPWEEDGYRGISLETYQKLGAIKCERGRYQNRICFPIVVNGEVIGVDARYLGDAKEDKVAKYLRPKNSSCSHNWLGFFDYIKAHKPKMVLLAEGIYHSVNAIDKGFPCCCYFGVNNFSHNKVMMLLSTGASEICYVPDPDIAGWRAAERICAALKPWFKVSVADMTPHFESERDLGDLSKQEIEFAVSNRGSPVLPLCLLDNWEYKIKWEEDCKRWRCVHNRKSKCEHRLYSGVNKRNSIE